MRGSPSPTVFSSTLAVVLVLAAQPAAAALCNVPSVGYPTLAAALADPTCDPIQAAAGTYPGNLAIARDVTITGAGSGSTTIGGWVSVRGAATDLVLHGIRIDASAA